MSKSDMKIASKKTKVILLVGVIILLVVGAGAALYFGYLVPSVKKVTNDKTAATSANNAYNEKLKQKNDQVTALVTAGDETSIKKADDIVNTQVTAAKATGDDQQIVDAELAKASLMIQTGRAQEAIDSVLTPLDQKYGSNESYRYEIYASFAYAYRQLDNPDKANQYATQIPGKGWDE
ncbi:hypothetical protein H7100_03475 [Candidatus Saccharibacteria bacterium]|nr:hypothetical protein [Candidatus Saccharibacteria bacterium]